MITESRMNLAGGILAGLAALVMSGTALAGHGKVGLWKVTVTMQGMRASIPEADRAQLKAMGVQMPNSRTITTQHCMTKAEVNSGALHAVQQPGSGCVLKNKMTSGQTYSADMVCNGEMKGRGRVSVSYDSPKHYIGKMTFAGTAHGRPANLANQFEGRWVSADCGGVSH